MSTLDRLHKCETELRQTQSYVQALHGEVAELKANSAHLGKMLMAAIETLIKSGVLDESKVMTKVTDLEDEQTKDHINQMLKLKAIKRSEEGNDKSVFILKQTKNGEVVSNYFLAPFMNFPKEIADQLIGAKDGFTFTHGLIQSEVLEIYNQGE